MSLLILIPFSIIGAFLIRYLCQAIPAQMYWEEENWLLDKLGLDISHSPRPLSQWKKYLKLDQLLIACFIICSQKINDLSINANFYICNNIFH